PEIAAQGWGGPSGRLGSRGCGWTGLARSGEKFPQRPVGLLRRLFRNEMAAVDGTAGHRLCMVAPDTEDVVAAALGAALPPQHQERHRQTTAAVGAVMDEVDRSTGAVLVAGRPDRLRVLEAAQVFGKDFGFECGRIARP